MSRSPMSVMAACICFVAVSCLFCNLGGCAGPPHMIDAAAIEVPLQSVADRHDRYVNADPTLSVDDKTMYLRSTTLLRNLQTEALKRGRADQVRGR
jgi:hypothetical protein